MVTAVIDMGQKPAKKAGAALKIDPEIKRRIGVLAELTGRDEKEIADEILGPVVFKLYAQAIRDEGKQIAAEQTPGRDGKK